MLIKMHLITLFRIMNPHQRCLQAKVKNRNEPKTGNANIIFVKEKVRPCLISSKLNKSDITCACMV